MAHECAPECAQQHPHLAKCSVCEELSLADETAYIGDAKICNECFKDSVVPCFEDAIVNETKYPVECWGVEVDIQRYPTFFSTDFRLEYLKKETEYATPKSKRLYCKIKLQDSGECGCFIANRDWHSVKVSCADCGFFTCGSCTESFKESPQEHICGSGKLEVEGLPQEGRGDIFQYCPKCETPIERTDGCNHMVCGLGKCREHFCYLCGDSATRASGHWVKGSRCPLYGRPGNDGDAGAQIFDAAPQDAERFHEELAHAQILHEIGADFRHEATPNDRTELQARQAHREDLMDIAPRIKMDSALGHAWEGLSIRQLRRWNTFPRRSSNAFQT